MNTKTCRYACVHVPGYPVDTFHVANYPLTAGCKEVWILFLVTANRTCAHREHCARKKTPIAREPQPGRHHSTVLPLGVPWHCRATQCRYNRVIAVSSAGLSSSSTCYLLRVSARSEASGEDGVSHAQYQEMKQDRNKQDMWNKHSAWALRQHCSPQWVLNSHVMMGKRHKCGLSS